jgi:hypothetical protein
LPFQKVVVDEARSIEQHEALLLKHTRTGRQVHVQAELVLLTEQAIHVVVHEPGYFEHRDG